VLTSTDPPTLAEQVAAAVGAHPSVVRLHGGTFGDLATHLPGRRLVGVRLGVAGEPVELGVVLLLDRPIPGVVRSLRRLVSGMCGGAPVDVTVGDVVVPGMAAGAEPPTSVLR
jgi:hypothetical protein